MVLKRKVVNVVDFAKIELVAKEAIRSQQMRTGKADFSTDVAKAIAAAIAEYDKQKSE